MELAVDEREGSKVARVSVEQKALTDSRFEAFAEELGMEQSIFSHAAGIGMMVKIWNECQERETKTLSPDDLRRLTRVSTAAEAILKADLGSPSKGGRIRIHGTSGRIEWLANARKKGRTGGRPKEPYGSEEEKGRDLSSNNPPAPAPALAPSKKNKKSNPASAKELVEAFAPTNEHISWAATVAPSVLVAAETEAWKDRCRANGYTTSKQPIKSAEASWRTAIRNAERYKTYADRNRNDYGRSPSRQAGPGSPAARGEDSRTIYRLRPASDFVLPAGEGEAGDLHIVPASGKP